MRRNREGPEQRDDMSTPGWPPDWNRSTGVAVCPWNPCEPHTGSQERGAEGRGQDVRVRIALERHVKASQSLWPMLGSKAGATSAFIHLSRGQPRAPAALRLTAQELPGGISGGDGRAAGSNVSTGWGLRCQSTFSPEPRFQLSFGGGRSEGAGGAVRLEAGHAGLVPSGMDSMRNGELVHSAEDMCVNLW